MLFTIRIEKESRTMERREFGKSLVGGAVGAGIAGGLSTEQAAAQAARTLKPKKNLE
jgi:hypothetical protein